MSEHENLSDRLRRRAADDPNGEWLKIAEEVAELEEQAIEHYELRLAAEEGERIAEQRDGFTMWCLNNSNEAAAILSSIAELLRDKYIGWLDPREDSGSGSVDEVEELWQEVTSSKAQGPWLVVAGKPDDFWSVFCRHASGKNWQLDNRSGSVAIALGPVVREILRRAKS